MADEKVAVRRAGADDHGWMLALGNRFHRETSWHTPESLARLIERASFCVVAEGEAGFLIGQTETDPAESVNFAWFQAREPRFLYVDRIVVNPDGPHRGVGRALYGAAIAHASDRPVVCEVNTQPPNPRSLAFHSRLGFAPVGEAVLGPDKAVAYLRRLPEPLP